MKMCTLKVDDIEGSVTKEGDHADGTTDVVSWHFGIGRTPDDNYEFANGDVHYNFSVSYYGNKERLEMMNCCKRNKKSTFEVKLWKVENEGDENESMTEYATLTVVGYPYRTDRSSDGGGRIVCNTPVRVAEAKLNWVDGGKGFDIVVPEAKDKEKLVD